MSGSDRKIRLLIIDDETSILETLGILFRGEGDFEVHTEARGEDAIRFIEDEAPDIVLSDIRMPGTTGLDVLAAANAADPELPVILMTAQASLQSAMEAVNRGAYYYIQKPFQNEELVAIVRRAAEARELKQE
ncbi:MAG TPA: response regulator, partial [Myxococcota bacterium]|nr:response regulator [Myxococcota bacterium]